MVKYCRQHETVRWLEAVLFFNEGMQNDGAGAGGGARNRGRHDVDGGPVENDWQNVVFGSCAAPSAWLGSKTEGVYISLSRE